MWPNSPTIRVFMLVLGCALIPSETQAQGGNLAIATQKSRARPTPPLPANEMRVPAVRWFTDRPRQYVLTEAFKYVPPLSREPIIVPAGFVTDFASIPGLVQPLFGPSVHDLPALVHDFLYWRQSCSREQADDVFYTALNVMGVSKARRVGIHLGLILGGPSAYRRNKRERNEQLPRIVPPSSLQIPVTTWTDFRKELRRQRVPLDPLDPKPPTYCRG
ncbi:MAG TPA: DUF1353 domain-containing protein [Longimicrobium sp.]|uniref:DUF1353 domain-containing protein n=1 Tax=Longimicrobium sp. TaxID=2029185 RepID=UPI002EDB1986